jgi:hypothetical protein
MKNFRNMVMALLVIFPIVTNASDQVDAIRYIEGRWTMVATFFDEGKWGTPAAPVSAVAQSILGGAFIRINMPVAFPGAIFQFELTLSYDSFNNVYRLAALDDVNGYLDIYSGQMIDKVLMATNNTTGSAFPDGNGGFVYGKLEIQQTEHGFQILGYTSSSNNEPFAPYMKLAFNAVTAKNKH